MPNFDGVTSHELELLVRTMLYHATPEDRKRLMKAHPTIYVKIYPHTSREIVKQVAIAVGRPLPLEASDG